MKCQIARELIESCESSEELEQHLLRCGPCRARRALWVLLGEARSISPSPAFSDRLLAALRVEGTRALQPAAAPGRAGDLEEFSDFPPGSLAQLLFGKLQRG